MIKEQKNDIIIAIYNLDEDCLINLNNKLNCNNIIFENTEENIKKFIPNPFDALKKAFYGNYNPGDNYANLNALSNLESADDVMEWVDIDAIAKYVISEEWIDNKDYCNVVISYCACFIEDNYGESSYIDIQGWLIDNYTTNEIIYGEWDKLLDDFRDYIQKKEKGKKTK